MNKLLPFDIFIILVFLFSGILLSVRFSHSAGGKVIVRANGEQYAYSLDAEGTHKVHGKCGETTFEIKNGKVRIVDSACPNKDCIRQGFGGTLVCLPNDVIITIENADGETDGEKGKFDAVSF